MSASVSVILYLSARYSIVRFSNRVRDLIGIVSEAKR